MAGESQWPFVIAWDPTGPCWLPEMRARYRVRIERVRHGRTGRSSAPGHADAISSGTRRRRRGSQQRRVRRRSDCRCTPTAAGVRWRGKSLEFPDAAERVGHFARRPSYPRPGWERWMSIETGVACAANSLLRKSLPYGRGINSEESCVLPNGNARKIQSDQPCRIARSIKRSALPGALPWGGVALEA
jgi:hypothetical protein